MTTTRATALTLAVFAFLGVAVISPISMLSPTQQAYAQTELPGAPGEGVTVTAECIINDDSNLHIRIEGEGERAGYIYQTSISNADGYQAVHSSDVIGLGSASISGLTFLEFGETYTIEVRGELEGQDVNAPAPFFTTEVTCPEEPEPEPVPLTERFLDQGSCIIGANTNPNAGFTKEDCKTAFKQKSK